MVISFQRISCYVQAVKERSPKTENVKVKRTIKSGFYCLNKKSSNMKKVVSNYLLIAVLAVATVLTSCGKDNGKLNDFTVFFIRRR